jgi:Ca-activated chloride channel family protein
MAFAFPNRFLLMLLPAALLGIYLLYWAWKRRAHRAIGDPELVAQMVKSSSGRVDVTRFALATFALVLLVVALTGPQWGEKQEQVERMGIDVVFALDLSRSMLVEDVPPSRLEAARAEIERVLNHLGGDRVGLVVFAGIAFTQCPLTSDYNAIRSFLRRLEPSQMENYQGTAIGRAINEGVRLLTGRRSASNDGLSTMDRGHDQIIVIITDGEDHETDPERAAARAREQGIRVFTVPIGTQAGGEVPVYRNGRRVRSLVDDRGQTVISQMNPESLDAIASAGGGMSIPYLGAGSVVGPLGREIDRLEAAELADILQPEKAERFYLFVTPAFLLLLVAMMLPDRRRRVPLIGFLSVAILIVGCGDTFVYESDRVDEALEMSAQGNAAEGLEEIRAFRDAIPPEDLLDPKVLIYNEGLILARSGEFEEAEDAFATSLGSSDTEVRFRSYYNLGNLAFDEEDYQQAHDRYVQALQVRPDDEDAKWNLELSLRWIFPPCYVLDDAFEDNDRPEEASPIEQPLDVDVQPDDGEAEGPERVLCGGDSDWYRLDEVAEGSRVSVTAQFHRLREDNGGAQLPDEIPSNSAWMTLYQGDGQTLLASNSGESLIASGQESMSALEFGRAIDHVVVPAGAVPTGTLYLELDANNGLEFDYTLDVEIIPPCSEAEDEHEDNDTRDTAAAIRPGVIPLQMCSGDDDWFRFTVFAGDTVFVDIELGPDDSVPLEDADGDGEMDPPEHTLALRAELFRAGSDEPVDTSWGRDAMLELRHDERERASDFDLRISAMLPETQGRYNLTLYRFAPCIAGDDEFEENDDLASAAQLSPQEAPFRHVRICDGDDDWYLVEMIEGEHFSISADYEEADRHISLALAEPGTTTVTAYGTESELPEPAQRDVDDLGPPAPRARFVRQIHVEEPAATDVYPIRLSGDSGFYNVTFPDPDSDETCDNPQEDEEDEEGEEEQEQEQDQDDDPESNEAEEEGDEQDQEQQDPSDMANEWEDEEMADELTDEEQRERRLQRLLDSLAEENLNLQLQQAIDDVPPIRVEREW